MYTCINVYMYPYIYVYMYIRIHACMDAWMYVCSLYVCTLCVICMACMVCLYLCMHELYVLLYVCIAVCMYVRTYACMCVCIHKTCRYTQSKNTPMLVCISIYIHTNVHICVYVYTCVCMCIYTYNIASCVHNLDVIDAYIHTDGNTDTQRLRSSSFLGLPYRILYMNPPKRNYHGAYG